MNYWSIKKMIGGMGSMGGGGGEKTDVIAAGEKSADESISQSIMDAQATGTDYDAKIHTTKGFGGVQDDTKEGWGWRNA